MSINNSDGTINKKDFKNNLSIDRSNFIINSCKNKSNYYRTKKLNGNPFKSMEPLIFEKKFNNQIDDNKKLVNSLSMVDIKPSFIKSKKHFKFNNNDFKPNPNIEEIPTFSYENDLNVESFKYFMNKKNAILQRNYDNYVKFMRKFENNNKKNQLISPYSLYIQKLNEVKNYGEFNLQSPKKKEIDSFKNIINRYDNYNNINNRYFNNNINNTNLSLNITPQNRLKNFNMNNYIEEVNKNREKLEEEKKEKENEKEVKELNNNNKNISNNFKTNKDIKYFPKNNEISNPELFYKKGNIDFYKYRKEQKKFDDYNYNIILNNNKNRFIKKEPDVNPFNPRINLYKIGNSSLAHNVILRPGDFYGYLKQSY